MYSLGKTIAPRKKTNYVITKHVHRIHYRPNVFIEVPILMEIIIVSCIYSSPYRVARDYPIVFTESYVYTLSSCIIFVQSYICPYIAYNIVMF